MTQTFYTQWQSSVLADAETYVSKEYSNFQTALLREISKYAEAVDAAVVSENKGHYYTCLLYTSPSPRDAHESRMPSSA